MSATNVWIFAVSCASGARDPGVANDTSTPSDDSAADDSDLIGDSSGSDDSGSTSIPWDDDGTAVARTESIANVATELFESATGAHQYQYAGAGVAFVPDLTGDGLPDVMIGAPAMQDAFESTGWGHAYVLAAPLDATQHEFDAVVQIDSVDRFDSGGTIVGSLGDLDDDGYPELVYGAPQGLEVYDGHIYIFSAPISGVVDTSLADAHIAGDAAKSVYVSTNECTLDDGWWAYPAYVASTASVVVRTGFPSSSDPFDGAVAVLEQVNATDRDWIASGDLRSAVTCGDRFALLCDA